jgi:hypothetical protein
MERRMFGSFMKLPGIDSFSVMFHVEQNIIRKFLCFVCAFALLRQQVPSKHLYVSDYIVSLPRRGICYVECEL